MSKSLLQYKIYRMIISLSHPVTWLVIWYKRQLRRILESLIIGLCAGDSRVLSKVNVAQVAGNVEQFVAELPPFYRFCFFISLFILEFALPPLVWKVRPFSKLPIEKRVHYLEDFQSSWFYFKRIIFKLPSVVCVLHLYSEPALLVYIGFEKSINHRQLSQVGRCQ